MTLLIDDRAGSRELYKYPFIRAIGQLTRLDSADAAFIGNGPDGDLMIGVELKKLPDLFGSIDTGRLQATQVPAMLKMYDHSYLLYYGLVRANPTTNALEIFKGRGWKAVALGRKRVMPYSWLAGSLMSIAHIAGIEVHSEITRTQAAKWLASLYYWWQRPWGSHKSMKKFDTSRTVRRNQRGALLPALDPDTLIRARIAAQLPGVGYERALEVAQHFGSIVSMMTATAEEWAEVKGIGKKIAPNVVAVIRKKVRRGKGG